MAKMSRKQMEKDERRILLELQNDSSQSLDRLAKKTRFSRQKVWRIVKILNENKDIWGYTAIVDEEKLGMKTYLLLFKSGIADISELFDTSGFNKLVDKEGIILRDVVWSQGLYDGYISFLARDIPHAKQLQRILSDLFPDQIMDTSIMESIKCIQRGGQSNPKM